MKHTLALINTIPLAPLFALHSTDATKLEPILSKHDDLIFSDSFDGPMEPEWEPSMKTRFAVADGTLNGHISSLKPHFRTGASLSKKKNTKKKGDTEEVLASSE